MCERVCVCERERERERGRLWDKNTLKLQLINPSAHILCSFIYFGHFIIIVLWHDFFFNFCFRSEDSECTRTLTYTHTLVHALSHKHIHTHTRSLTLTQTHRHTLVHALSHKHKCVVHHTHKISHSQMFLPSHAYKITHTSPNTLTYYLSVSLFYAHTFMKIYSHTHPFYLSHTLTLTTNSLSLSVSLSLTHTHSFSSDFSTPRNFFLPHFFLMKVLWHSDEANQSKLRLFSSDRKESSKQWREDSLKIEIVAINTNYGSRQQKELKMEQLNDATFEECCLDTTSQNVKTYFLRT